MCTYLDTKNKSDCYGCTACKYACPKNCITMTEDSEGFLYPQINEDICINCNLCRKACIKNKEVNNEFNVSAYACINKNKSDRMASTSGAVFPLMADVVINAGGVVVGAEYNDQMEVVHGFALNREQVSKFKQSKYVRSNIVGVYPKIKSYLLENKIVMFTGTPCQVAGLLKFLGKKYDNLITCDIVCHSNPSPKVFKKYIDFLEKSNKKVSNIIFRDKSKGWHNPSVVVTFNDGTEYDNNQFMNDSFFRAFGYELISRPSCHTCEFAEKERVSDITFGDCWGIEKIIPNMDDNKGTSLIMVNTTKGQQMFEKISDKLDFKQFDRKDALIYNHHKPKKPNVNRGDFFAELDKVDIEVLFKKYLNKTKRRVSLGRFVPSNLKSIIKKILR